MGWRNYATTQQPTSASFDNPSFPLASADNYARYFLGAALPFTTPFTTVSASGTLNGRTDQAVMSRQELIKLQRTIGIQPEPASIPRDLFPRNESAGARLAPADRYISRRKVGHE